MDRYWKGWSCLLFELSLNVEGEDFSNQEGSVRMKNEIISFIDIKRSRGENEKSRATIPTVDPESMFNEKDEPSRYHTEHFLPKTPFDYEARINGLRSGRRVYRPAIMCVNMISQRW